MLDKKWIRCILPGFTLAFIYFVFAPIDLYFSNIGEFWFSYEQILPWLLIWFAACVLVITLLLWFLPKKISLWIEMIIYVISILLYIQGNYLVINYGTLNGEAIDWTQYSGTYLWNTFIWITALLSTVILFVLFREKISRILRILAIVILCAQVAGLVSTMINGMSQKEDIASDRYLSKRGEFNISSKENTIVILLDCFDSQLFENLYKEDPNLIEDTFQDFIFYRNMVGGATRTKYAIPYIFTGQTNTKEQSYQEYLKDSYQNSVLFEEFRNSDYDTGIYTSGYLVDLRQDSAIDNIETGRSEAVSTFGLTGDFLQLVSFRYVPSVFSQYFWMYSGQFEKWKATTDTSEYSEDDAAFYNELKEKKLNISTEKKVFRFYHLNGAHAPYTYNANVEKINNGYTTEEDQAKGSFTIVREYLNQLRELGCYENANVIIMSDHGFMKYSIYEQNPLFLMKRANEHHIFLVDETPVSYRNLAQFFVECVKGKAPDYSHYKESGERLFYAENEDGILINIVEYAIDGAAWDNNAIKPTGNIYHGNTLNPSRNYKLGDILSFAEEDNARNYIVSGFSANEGWGTWTDGKHAELCFDIQGSYNSLLVSVNISKIHGNQDMIIYANDNKIIDYENIENGEVQFVIPHNLLDTNKLSLVFELPKAFSPKSLGLSTDSRDLALGFLSLKIVSTDRVE